MVQLVLHFTEQFLFDCLALSEKTKAHCNLITSLQWPCDPNQPTYFLNISMILCYIIRENRTYLTFSCLCCSGNSFIMNINDIYSLLFNPISKATLHKSKQMSENVPCLFWCSTTVKPQGVALKSVNLYVPAVSKQTFPLCCYAAVDCNQVQIQGTWTTWTTWVLGTSVFPFHATLQCFVFFTQTHLFDTIFTIILQILHIKTYDKCIKYDDILIVQTSQ